MMLAATEEEALDVIRYMEREAPDLTVEFAQKVCSENVLDHHHDVWDVHTDSRRNSSVGQQGGGLCPNGASSGGKSTCEPDSARA
jgi:hypothetical protein